MDLILVTPTLTVLGDGVNGSVTRTEEMREDHGMPRELLSGMGSCPQLCMVCDFSHESAYDTI